MSKKMPAIIGAAIAVAALATVGCAAASATSAAKSPRPTAHLTAFTTDDGPAETVVVTGAIGDYGQAVSVNPDGSVDPEHKGLLELRLAHGTFRLDIAAIDKAFVAAMDSRFPGDKATCSGSVDVTQRVPIVPGSGTGAYKSVGGSFSLTLALDEVDKVGPGAPCDGSAAFLGQILVTSGPGDVTL